MELMEPYINDSLFLSFNFSNAPDNYSELLFLHRGNSLETVSHVPNIILDDTYHLLKFICITFISVFIILCNILNIYIVSKTQQLPRITRICLLNLSCSDLLVGLVSCLPCTAAVLLGYWPYGEVMCQIAGILHGSSVTISIWSLSLISIDRYLAIKRPLRYKFVLTLKRTYMIIGGLWILALCTFFLPIPTKPSFIYYKFSQEELICGLYWEYKWFCVITAIYIPIASGIILVVTNISVMNKVMTLKKKTHGQAGFNYSRVRNNDIRAVKLLIVASVVYFISWGPYVTEVVAISLFNVKSVPVNVMFVTMWLANSNSFTNVFVYSVMYRSYRKQLKSLVTKVICCGHCKSKVDAREEEETRSAERSYQLTQYG